MSIPVLSLPDRRSGTTQQTRFIFLYDLERALYADRGHSTGSIHRLLARQHLQRTTLPLKKCSVQEGIVTEAEFKEVIQTFQEVLPSGSRGRVRSATLLPLSVAAVATTAFGRSEKSINFLQCFQQPIPRQWELLAEQEENDDNGEVDYVLNEEVQVQCILY